MNERRKLLQRLSSTRKSIRSHKILNRVPTETSNSLQNYVKISPLELVPTHFSRLIIGSNLVKFKSTPQPINIFERVIQRLFTKFLNGKSPPQKIGLSFRTLPHGEQFFIPLRTPISNSYSTLSREVERHVQSGDESLQLRGLQILFKMTGQWSDEQIEGACIKKPNLPFSGEIDISESSNNYCLFYAILAGIQCSKLKLSSKQLLEKAIYKWAKKTNVLKQVKYLLVNSGCSLNKSSYNLKHVQAIQNYLNRIYPNEFRIVVATFNSIVFKGPPAKHLIPIKFFDQHFTLLKNLAHYFGVSF